MEIRPEINQEQLPEYLREDYEIRERTEEDIKEPPKSWRETIKFFGPSFVIMGATVGSGELISTTILGAKIGFVLLWMLVIGVILKATLQELMARYVIYTGKGLMDVLDEVPGKVGTASWAVWWAGFLLLSLLVNMAGIVGVMGLAVQGLLGFGNPNFWGLIISIIGVLLLIRGIYDDLEKVTIVLVGIFSLITVAIAFFLIQSTPYAYRAADLASGFTFSFPPEGWFVALAVFGATGITANEILTYTYWVKGKGYAAWAGPRKSRGFNERANGWIKVMRADIIAGSILVIIVTVAFYILGAAVLHVMGKVPAGFEVIETISSIYTESVGPWTRTIFMIASIAILFTTFTVNTAGIARIIGDVLFKGKLIKDDSISQKIKIRRLFTFLGPAVMLLMYFLIPAPTQLILVGQFLLALSLPIAAIVAFILESKLKKDAPELALRGFGTALLGTSGILIIGFVLTSYFLG
ncbi:MAG: Nramp family divalent metal transporter [Peptococcaceae bacterium]